MIPGQFKQSLSPNDVFLETERLIIRPLRPDDFTSWQHAHMALDAPKNVWDTLKPTDENLQQTAFDAYVHSVHALILSDTNYYLSVFLKTTNQYIGGVSVMDVSRGRFENGYFGYSILHHHWRQGYAREACKVVIDFAFQTLKLHRLEAGIEPDNLPSCALAQSLGFQFECLSPKRLYVRGVWQDMKLFVLRHEN